MKKIILFLSIILLLIIVGYVYPLDTSNNFETGKQLNFLVEKLIQQGKNEIEKGEQRHRDLVDNLNNFKKKVKQDLRTEITKDVRTEISEKILDIAKANKDVTKDYYETIKTASFIIRWIIPIGFIISLLILIIKSNSIKNFLCDWIYKGFRIDERDTKNWAKMINIQGIFYYNEAVRLKKRDDRAWKSMIDLAIACNEGAYKRIKNMHEKTQNKDEDKFFTRIKSNLCYYYGMAEKEDKFFDGLELARLSLNNGQKYNNLNWIDNYLYFITQFISNEALEQEEIDKAKFILRKYKASLMANDICSKDGIKFFEQTLLYKTPLNALPCVQT